MCSDALPNVGRPLIRVRGISKCYQIYRNPLHRLLQGLIGSYRKLYREFWALTDINLEVYPGETLGIVGRNGSGKSTLLQLIAGTLEPTTGEIEVEGRVAALLELGSGFNPDFTGRENVYLNAAILGLSRAEIDARYEAIERFADIGDFIDQPVSTYSSGMVMRLAFAVMANVDADILIIDEALAVGDAFFTQKCMRYLREFKKRGTLLFVSHDSAAVSGLCDRATWLDGGRQRATGAARDIVDAYLEEFLGHRQGGNSRRSSSPGKPRESGRPKKDFRQDLIDRSQLRNDIRIIEFDPGVESYGAMAARIVDVELLDVESRPLGWVTGGESVILRVVVESVEPLSNLIVGFYVRDRLGQLLFGDNTYLITADAPVNAGAGDLFEARFHFDMPRLLAGDYFITVGVATGEQDEHVVQNWMNEALQFQSRGMHKTSGIIGIPMHAITLERA